MQRAAVFVDAGYVFAQGSVLLTGAKQSREYLSLDIPGVVKALTEVVAGQTGLPLLRIYWYDAMRLGRPTAEQTALANTSNIKTRLGNMNSAGEQKGVDALIITDMIDLARNHSILDAVLVSGDEDVRVGVVLAQQFGVRVHLVGIQPARANQSPALVQESDTLTEWDEAVIRGFLAYSPPVTPTAAVAAATAGDLDAQLAPLVTALSPSDLAALKSQFATNTQVPAEHDRSLLRVGRGFYQNQTLSSTERTALRVAFVRLVLAK